jgi:hypothetical protein
MFVRFGGGSVFVSVSGDQRLQQELEPNASWWLVGNLRGFLNLFQGSVFWARKLLT